MDRTRGRALPAAGHPQRKAHPDQVRSPMRLQRLVASTLLVTGLLSACTREPAPPEAPATAPPQAWQEVALDWPAFAAAFIESRFKADPAFAVRSGRHDFDGSMPDFGRAALEADVARLREQREQLRKFDGAALTPAQRFERKYLEWILDTEIFWRATAAEPFRNPAWYIEKLDPSMYLTRDYAPLAKRMQGFLGYARAVPKIAADIRANLATPLPRPFVERAVAGFGGYARFFRTEVPGIFAQLDDDQQKQELHEATAAAANAMDELATWLQSTTATDDFALGAPLFSEMLRSTERVDLAIEE